MAIMPSETYSTVLVSTYKSHMPESTDLAAFHPLQMELKLLLPFASVQLGIKKGCLCIRIYVVNPCSQFFFAVDAKLSNQIS